MIYFYIFLSSFLIMLASLSGSLFLRKRLNDWMHKHIEFLVTLSAGVFVFVSYGLISEAINESTVLLVTTFFILGVVLLELFSRIIPEAHHHHRSHSHDHAHSRIDARRMLAGDAMHNVADGFLLSIAFMADIRIGFATAVAIFLHELVQEISEFFVLKEAGYTDKEALTRNFAVSGTIIIGVVIGLFVSFVGNIEASLSAVAAGGFVYIILRDLIPSTVSSVLRNGRMATHILSFVLGLVIMVILGITGGH